LAIRVTPQAIVGRGAACESPCRAIHPEIPQRGIEGLRPNLPRCQLCELFAVDVAFEFVNRAAARFSLRTGSAGSKGSDRLQAGAVDSAFAVALAFALIRYLSLCPPLSSVPFVLNLLPFFALNPASTA
jgi:hypothetical protein